MHSIYVCGWLAAKWHHFAPGLEIGPSGQSHPVGLTRPAGTVNGTLPMNSSKFTENGDARSRCVSARCAEQIESGDVLCCFGAFVAPAWLQILSFTADVDGNKFLVSCCAKSLWGEAPCDSAVYGSWMEMSPAPLPQPPAPPSPLWLDPPVAGPPPHRQHGWWKTRRTRKN